LILLCCCFPFQKKLAMDFSGRSILILAIVTRPRPVWFVFSKLLLKQETVGPGRPSTICAVDCPSNSILKIHPILLVKFYTNLQGQARHKVEYVAQEYFGRWRPLQSLQSPRRRQASCVVWLRS
jgi:hypothetical protein